MEAIKQQFTELKAIWSEVYPAMRANPTAWQPHLPGLFPEQIDEVISTISVWLGKVEAPQGFKPSFHLAKGLVATSLPQLLAAAKSLQKAEYNFLQSFVGGLNQILSALHSMVVYSSKHGAQQLAADMAAQLSEALSLLGTAQTELRNKADLLSASSKIAEDTEARAKIITALEGEITEFCEETTKALGKLKSDTEAGAQKILGDATAKATQATADLEAKVTTSLADIEAEVKKLNTETQTKAATLITELENQTSQTVESIESLNTTAGETAGQITTYSENCAALEIQIKALLQRNLSLNSTLNEQTQRLDQLQQASKSQSDLIEKLLPKGASTGLSEGFETRAAQLGPIKIMWMLIFMLSILGLVVVAVWLAVETKGTTGVQLWTELLHRLPFAAPLIWLGWFSAIQYGNTIRVQEDYSFKAATSKAFAGYKDHMDHMANVNLDEANNAMKLLAARTIEILAHEPLRIYQKSERDVSPTNSFLSALGRAGKGEKPAGETPK